MSQRLLVFCLFVSFVGLLSFFCLLRFSFSSVLAWLGKEGVSSREMGGKQEKEQRADVSKHCFSEKVYAIQQSGLAFYFSH